MSFWSNRYNQLARSLWKKLVFRYGKNNGFALYSLPTPREGQILGLLGRNGIGKSTAVKILAGQEKINLGKNATDQEIKDFFKGNELQRYFDGLKKKKVSYKPQNLANLSVDLKVIDLLKKRGKEAEIKKLAKRLEIENILENKLNRL